MAMAMVSSGTDRNQCLELDQVVGGDHGGQVAGAGVQPHLPRVGVRGLGVGHPHTLQHAKWQTMSLYIEHILHFHVPVFLCKISLPCP